MSVSNVETTFDRLRERFFRSVSNVEPTFDRLPFDELRVQTFYLFNFEITVSRLKSNFLAISAISSNSHL